MSLRYYEIAEKNHKILDPIQISRLVELGIILDLNEKSRLLDIACGKGEMLCRWSKAHKITGMGIDISSVFLEEAEERAIELEVSDSLTFKKTPAEEFSTADRFDIVSCLGATWIGQGTIGTLKLMETFIDPNGPKLFLLGDIFWKDEPNEEIKDRVGEMDYGWAVGLDGMNKKFKEAGFELLYMMISTEQEWDAYETRKWLTFRKWYEANPTDPEREALNQFHNQSRLDYLEIERPYCGWGVFVLKKV